MIQRSIRLAGQYSFAEGVGCQRPMRTNCGAARTQGETDERDLTTRSKSGPSNHSSHESYLPTVPKAFLSWMNSSLALAVTLGLAGSSGYGTDSLARQVTSPFFHARRCAVSMQKEQAHFPTEPR